MLLPYFHVMSNHFYPYSVCVVEEIVLESFDFHVRFNFAISAWDFGK